MTWEVTKRAKMEDDACFECGSTEELRVTNSDRIVCQPCLDNVDGGTDNVDNIVMCIIED